jgi:hypothetical protein|tara:strand:+ start:4135 stop:5529 length:1395 start_codon:yes stop_codon:yes gene_type:complete
MNLPVVWSLLLAAVLLTTGCNKDDDDDGPAPVTQGSLQVVNAIIDSQLVTFRIKTSSSEDFNPLDQLQFRQASQLALAPADDYDVEITYLDPLTNETIELLPDFQFTLTAEMVYTFILHGDFTNPQTMLLEKPRGDLDTGDAAEFEAQIVHVGTGEALDVYLGDPNATIDTSAPLTTLIPGASTQPLLRTAGLQRLRLTEAGDSQVLYDSGTFNLVGRTRRTFLLHDNVGPDANTKDTVLLTESGTIEHPNEVARAGFRVFNAVPDETSITVDLIDATSEQTLETVTLGFTEVTDFAPITATFIDVSVAAASAPGVEANRTTVSLNQDTFYTLTVGGSIPDDSLSVRSSTSPQRPIATFANLHFVNTLRETDDPEIPRVDLYALEVGDALDDDVPRFVQFGFLASAAAIVPPMLMDLVVTTSGTNAILVGPVRVDMVARSSIIVVATEATGGGEPYQIIVETTQ